MLQIAKPGPRDSPAEQHKPEHKAIKAQLTAN